MITLITLFRNDLKLAFKDWKAIVLLLLMPLLSIAFFTYALSPYLNKSSFIEPFDIAVVDNENTTQTRILLKQLEEIEIFKEIHRVDENKAKELISGNKVAAAIIIPEKFSDSVAVGENKPVTVIGNRAMPLQSFVVKNLIQSAANLVSAGQSAINTIYYYNQKAGLDKEELQKEFSDSTMKFFVEALARNEIFSQVEAAAGLDVTPVEYFTAALVAVFLMFAGMPGLKMLVTERSLGITRKLMASPARMWHIILSKFATSLVLSVMQFSIVIVFTSYIFKNYWGAPVKNILMLFGSIIFAVSAWSILVSALSTTPASADAIGNLGILLMAVIGGSIYPLSSMPEFVRTLSKATINRWAMDGFLIIFSGNDALTVTSQVYALLAIGLACLGLSVIVLRLRRC